MKRTKHEIWLPFYRIAFDGGVLAWDEVSQGLKIFQGGFACGLNECRNGGNHPIEVVGTIHLVCGDI